MVHNIKNIVIAGAGVMGSSMAQLFAAGGYQVTLYDISEAALYNSQRLIHVNQNVMHNDKTEGEKEENIRENITFSSEKECFSDADFVIEAIVEKMEVKHGFWNEVSGLAPDKAVLTSNTSGLSLTEIAKAVKYPERFCGMHWLNPPHICPLVEIIKGEKTAPETMGVVYDLACDIHRYPVCLQKEVPGFLVNRFQFAILREAMSLVEAGVARKEDIDKVFKYGLGLRYACLGPFEIADLGGLDTFYNIAGYLFADISNEKNVHKMLEQLYRDGDYGVKTGKGFYDYGNGRAEEVIAKRDKDFMKVVKCLYEE